tara:strand:- start:1056 stop:1568 length:513 start_codon:yes stop_codon:yes gene_type:complete
MQLFKNAVCNPTQKPFKYISSWERLRRHPKWGSAPSSSCSSSSRADRKRKHTVESIDDGTDEDSILMEGDTSVQQNGRPFGKKKVKEEKFFKEQSVKQVNNSEKLAAAAEKKANALVHLNQIQCARLFTVDAGANSSECDEYMSLLRRKALYQLREGMFCIAIITLYKLI